MPNLLRSLPLQCLRKSAYIVSMSMYGDYPVDQEKILALKITSKRLSCLPPSISTV